MMFLLYAALTMLFYMFLPYYNKIHEDNKIGKLPLLRRAYVGVVLVQVTSVLLFSLEVLAKVLDSGHLIVYFFTTLIFIIISFVLNIILATLVEQRYLQSTQLAGFFIADMDKEVMAIVIMVTGIQAANVSLYNYINIVT